MYMYVCHLTVLVLCCMYMYVCHLTVLVLCCIPTGEAILPIPRHSSEMWRMIHFKYKKHRVLSHTIDGFDFPTVTSRQHDHSLSRIPSEAIRTELPTVDPKLAEATLEVGLNNPILEAGFEIICSPTSVSGTLDAVRKSLQVCQVELHPFFVCGHDGKAPLNSQVSWGWEGEGGRG